MRRNVFTEGMNGPNDDEKCYIHVIWKSWEKKWHLANRQMMLICKAFGLQITMCDPELYLRKLLSESLMHGRNMTEPTRIPLRQRHCSSQKKNTKAQSYLKLSNKGSHSVDAAIVSIYGEVDFLKDAQKTTKWFYFYFCTCAWFWKECSSTLGHIVALHKLVMHV